MPEATPYWARFEERDGLRLRFDTRIYLTPQDRPRRGDRAIGCIIGKNPGSATPSQVSGRLQAIALKGDRFLPTVRAIVSKARLAAGLPEGVRGEYIQVLNLFYVCNRDLRAAKGELARVESAVICPTERRSYPWHWYAWGGHDPLLNPLKARFLRRRPRQPLFFDGATGCVETAKPLPSDAARHTQGMPHEAMVAALAAALKA